jgi:hypothetical protein
MSPQQAWKDIQTTAEFPIIPGDIVLFKKDCVWSHPQVGLDITVSGTPTSQILFSSYGGGLNPPAFEGTRQDRSFGIRIDAEWVIINNLSVIGGKNAGIYYQDNAHNTIVSNIDISNVGFGIFINSNNNTIVHNTIHDLYMVKNTPSGDDDYGATGIVISGSNNEIYSNIINNSIDKSYDYGVDGGVFEFWSQDNKVVENNYIHHNWGEDSDGFLEIGANNGEIIRNNTFAYNVSVNNGSAGVFHIAEGFSNYGATIKNLKFHNNTFYEIKNELNFSQDRISNLSLFWFSAIPQPQTFYMQNNLFYIEGFRHFIYPLDRDSFIHSYNLYFFPNSSKMSFWLTPDASEIIGINPLFSDRNQHDLTLSVLSPAVDTGTITFNPNGTIYTLDYLERAVPIDGNGDGEMNFDIGAFEFRPPLLASP